MTIYRNFKRLFLLLNSRLSQGQTCRGALKMLRHTNTKQCYYYHCYGKWSLLRPLPKRIIKNEYYILFLKGEREWASKLIMSLLKFTKDKGYSEQHFSHTKFTLLYFSQKRKKKLTRWSWFFPNNKTNLTSNCKSTWCWCSDSDQTTTMDLKNPTSVRFKTL